CRGPGGSHDVHEPAPDAPLGGIRRGTHLRYGGWALAAQTQRTARQTALAARKYPAKQDHPSCTVRASTRHLDPYCCAAAQAGLPACTLSTKKTALRCLVRRQCGRSRNG